MPTLLSHSHRVNHASACLNPFLIIRLVFFAVVSQVMWLKSMAAWLVNRLGYHVLFQDADVVWFQVQPPTPHPPVAKCSLRIVYIASNRS